MSPIPRSTIFYGLVINPQTLSSYQALPDCLLCVSPSGDIDWIEEDVAASMVQEAMVQKGSLDADLVELKRGEFIMPGFVDTHTHGPQFPNIGSGQQHELLDWLRETTFPMEAKYADVQFARRAYDATVKRIINSGTTTCCYYGSLHLEATKALAEIVHAYGQRAFVGKCNMNRDSPDDYIEPSVEASIAATTALIAHIRSLPDLNSPALVQPVLTPRFAISCTPPLLSSLGSLAREDPTLLVQTHIGENQSEIAYTKTLFPECRSYADVYDHYGLLGRRTVLAHAVYLEEEEVQLIKSREAGISHCPTSNLNLRSGVCKVGELLDRGIKIGLGTDVSGGYSQSILTEIKHASIASKIIQLQSPTTGDVPSPATFANRQLPLATLLHLATLGGAQVCDLQSRIGSFAPGKAFDALLVSVNSTVGNPGLWGVDQDAALGIQTAAPNAMLERFFFTGDDRNIRRVYVQGKWIGGAEQRR